MKNSILGISLIYITLSWKFLVIEAAIQGLAQSWTSSSRWVKVEGDISIRQKEATSKIVVEGTVCGLEEGAYILQLVSLARGGCNDVSPVMRANLHFWDQSMNENHTIEGGGRPREDRPQDPELSVNDVAGLVIRKCVHYESDLKCNEEDILACAPVTWLEEPKVFGLDWKMLVIIAISVLIFFLLIVCIPLICCCIKKKKNPESSDMDMDIENEYPPRSKSPMYDELSLPFIDASLPPTPKVGRIVNGLDILLGRGVSENSLVDKKSQVQW